MKTRNKIISLLICICMLMQFIVTVAFAETEYGYILNEPSGSMLPGGSITYFDVQQNMSDDAKSVVKYNSDFYDYDAENRETPYVTFTNTETKESFDELLEGSPLKCVYEEDENGNQSETGRYNLEVYIPEEIESGTYNLKVMTYPPEGKKALSTVGPIHFSIPNVIVESVDTSIFTYTIENGEVTITGCDTSVTGELEIPETIDGYPVTSIGISAFAYCTYLTSIIIPDTVTNIAGNVFFECVNLTSVTLPEGITNISNDTFYLCKSLKDITIPNGVTGISFCAFQRCETMTSITLPNTVTNIDDNAFDACSSLKDVYFCGTEEEWNAIAIGTYGNDALLNATIHFAVEEPDPEEPDEPSIFTYTIENGEVTITGCDTSANGIVEIPETIEGYPVTVIGESAFKNCKRIITLVIPEGVVAINKYAFESCSRLTYMVLPSTLVTVGISVFTGMPLTDIYYGGTEEEWGDISVGMGNYHLSYIKNMHYGEEPDELPSEPDVSKYTYKIVDGEVTITDYPTSGSGYIYLPETIEGYPVTAIGDNAFQNCNQVTGVDIPEGIKVIGNDAFNFCTGLQKAVIEGAEIIGEKAFYYCSKLADVTILSSMSKISTSTFENCRSLASITIPETVQTICNRAFYNCTALAEVKLPADLLSIDSYAFYNCTGLVNIEIPGGTETIGESAFDYCTKLALVKIPESVTNIDKNAFSYCGKLTEVYYGGTETKWNAITIGEGNDKLLSATVYFAEDPEPDVSPYTYTIANEAVTITDCDESLSGDVEIPATIENYPVKVIGEDAFALCKNITSIKMSDLVDTIEDRAFSQCTALESITIPKYVDIINNNLFWGCESLTEVIIEGDVTYLGSLVFYGCTSLGEITIPETVTRIEDQTFEKCKNLKKIIIPDGVTHIGGQVFTDCSSLESVTIPTGITGIGYATFSGCESLTDVYYQGTKSQWEAISMGLYNDPLLNATIHFAVEEPDPEEPDVPEEPEEPTDSEIVFTIEDTTTLLPVPRAKVLIVNADETKAQEIISDENGNAALAIPNGTYTVQVMASGYDIRTFTVEKTDENYEFSVYLNKNPLIKIETSAKVMTKQEMVDAGIDVEAADNKQVYKCTTVLKFVPVTTGEGDIDITPIEINFDYIYDAQGTIINAQPVRQDGVVIYPVAKDIYLIVHSETTWLKEMFDVQLVVANTSSIEKIKDCEVNLDLPDGLSLATMVEGEQSLTVSVAEIKPKETKDIHWYVRGDEAGEYIIGGNITGVREGGGIIEDLKASFTMQDPVTVLAGDAMKLKIEAERFATAGQPYKMRYTLQNVSSRTLYDVALNVLGGKFCKAYSVEELIHNGELVDLDALAGSFNNGVELKDEEFEPGEVLTGVFEITFGQGITTENIEYMVTEMYTFTGEGSTTTIPTEVVLVDSVGDHVYDDGEITVEPTCTTSGTMVYSCTTCSETMEVTVPALGHALGNWATSQEPTCTAEGEKHRGCRNCEYTETAVLGKVSHKYDLEVITEPTTTDEGVMKCTCSVCGEVTTVPISVCTIGDTNGDEGIDTKDVISVRRFISGGYGVNVYLAAADANKDGIVDVKDVILVRRFVVGGYGVEL